MYIELPLSIETCYGKSKNYVLLLLSNLNHQKQAGRLWNGYMVEKLLSIGFQQSQIGECVFYKGDINFIVYVDDGIFLGNNDKQLNEVIRESK